MNENRIDSCVGRIQQSYGLKGDSINEWEHDWFMCRTDSTKLWSKWWLEQRRSESMDNIDFALLQSYLNSQIRVIPFPNEVTGKSPIFLWVFSFYIYQWNSHTEVMYDFLYTFFFFFTKIAICLYNDFLELKFIPLSTILFVTMDSYVSSLFWLVC